MDKDINCFVKYKKFIAWCEIAALLHDIGKLSSVWLEYRRAWQEKNQPKWNYYNDPHCNDFFHCHDQKIASFNDLKNTLQQKINSTIWPSESDYPYPSELDTLYIEKIVNCHECCSSGKPFLFQLKLADSIDSAYDRNNPLFCREQKTSQLFDTEVFGHECDKKQSKISKTLTEADYAELYLRGVPPSPHPVDFNDIDNKRIKLYEYLNTDNRLGKYLDNPNQKQRLKILGAIRAALDYGMADTCRPGNDTTLWEHSYSVANLFKAAVLRYIATGKFYENFNDFRFSIVGIGWDGMSYLANVPRLNDALGRQQVIYSTIDKVRENLEWELPCGSLVYWDVNQAVFLMPDGLDKDQIMSAVKPIFRSSTNCDLFPKIFIENDCSSLTAIIKVTDNLRKKRHIPVNNFDKYDLDNFRKGLETGSDLCKVCKRRTVIKSGLCQPCIDNHDNSAKESRKKRTTAFLSEIVRGNTIHNSKRIALVAVHFGFANWLSGRMHRTMMVTEAKGIQDEIANLGNINYGKDGTGEPYSIIDNNRKEHRKNWDKTYNYHKILQDMERLLDPPSSDQYIDATMFVYGSRASKELEEGVKRFLTSRDVLLNQFNSDYGFLNINSIKKENLAIALCTKTPTPSTLLDTWHAPYRFLKELSVPAHGNDNVQKWLEVVEKAEHQIVECEFKQDKDNITFGFPYKCISPSGNRFEAIFFSEDSTERNDHIKKCFVIEGKLSKIDSGQEHKIYDTEIPKDNPVFIGVKMTDGGTEEYWPVREVLLSPDLGLLMVPAEHAFDVATKIERKYNEEFGKVRGRLSMNIGLLYFNYKHPVYLVLDAARRMIEGFEERDAEEFESVVVNSNPEEGTNGRNHFDVKIQGTGRICPFEIEYKLGDGETDFHHPYIYTTAENNRNDSSFFKTISWENNELCGMIHFFFLKKRAPP
ncbi:MAG TPA: hypothetical protein DCO75_07955, partial [Fibrobacteres bacterium]|nr:hypothetical protein [Fibrobacterota bacterium]